MIEAVGVVVPAHDEEELLPACLAGLTEAAAMAVEDRPGLRVRIVVAADACTDGTVAVARQALVPGEVPDCKLGTLAAYFETPAAPSHRALADARATAAVLDVLITRLALLGVRTLDDLSNWLSVP